MCACPDQLAECWLCEIYNPMTSPLLRWKNAKSIEVALLGTRVPELG